VCWLMYEVGVWLDLRHQQIMRTRAHVETTSGLAKVRLFSDVLILMALGIRLVMEREYYKEAPDLEFATDLYRAYQVLISLKVFFLFSGWMPFISEYRPLGVLIITVTEMVDDVVKWMMLFMIMTGAFMISLAGLQSAGMYLNDGESDIDYPDGNYTIEDLEFLFSRFSPYGSVWSPLWALFGDFDPGRYNWLAATLMWVYCLIGSVVLVNLLVAQFADTFSRIKAESEMEYVYLRVTRLFNYKHLVLPVPPIFNTPYVLWDICSYMYTTKTARKIGKFLRELCCHCCACCRRGEGTRGEMLKHTNSSPDLGRTEHGVSISEVSPSAQGKRGVFALAMGVLTPRGRGSRSTMAGGLKAVKPSGRETGRESSKKQSIFVASTSGPPTSDQAEKHSSFFERRPLQAENTIGGGPPPLTARPEGAHVEKKRRPATLFDGKLLAVSYLKEVRKKEADTVHALTRALRSELAVNMKHREAEYLRLAARVGGIETKLGAVDQIQESLASIQTQLTRLGGGSGDGEEMTVRRHATSGDFDADAAAPLASVTRPSMVSATSSSVVVAERPPESTPAAPNATPVASAPVSPSTKRPQAPLELPPEMRSPELPGPSVSAVRDFYAGRSSADLRRPDGGAAPVPDVAEPQVSASEG